MSKPMMVIKALAGADVRIARLIAEPRDAIANAAAHTEVDGTVNLWSRRAESI